jgi:hypothetical protein
MLGVVIAAGVSGVVVIALGVAMYKWRQHAAMEMYKEYLKYMATKPQE